MEHGISHLANWRALSRHLGRREHLDTILRAIAALAPSQEQAPRPDRFTAHRKPCRLAPPGYRTCPEQVSDRPPLTMHEVASKVTPLEARSAALLPRVHQPLHLRRGVLLLFALGPLGLERLPRLLRGVRPVR